MIELNKTLTVWVQERKNNNVCKISDITKYIVAIFWHL